MKAKATGIVIGLILTMASLPAVGPGSVPLSAVVPGTGSLFDGPVNAAINSPDGGTGGVTPENTRALSLENRRAFALENTKAPAPESTRSLDLSSYHNYSQIADFLYESAELYPEIASVHVLGQTWQGRDILALKISDDVATEDAAEPDVLYMGAHHGNELISAEVPLYLIDLLLTGYSENSTIGRWVDTREIWFVPVVNPDGLDSTLAGVDSRKNRRPIDADGDGIIDGVGVDLNRNYDQNWGTQGTSTSVGDVTYSGPSPFSEAESQAIMELAIDHDFVLSLSFHSYGQQVFFPWGNSIEATSPERTTLEAIAGEMAERNGYQSMEGKTAYLTSGDSDDWLYANTDSLPFTVELGTMYAPPPSDILAICEENRDSSLYLLDIADDPTEAEKADWTFMVYMAADNSLDAAALDDLNEMATVGSTMDVNILVLYDGQDGHDSRIFYVEKDITFDTAAIPGNYSTRGEVDDGGSVIGSQNEVNMADPATLSNFINWTLGNYPAQKTALVIWNHGIGLFEGLCQDGSDFMDTWELREALDGRNFDVVGMDLCWQGNVELAYELKGHADYFVASETEEPEAGWDYAATLGWLTANPNAAPRLLSARIVTDYLTEFAGVGYITMAAVDMRRFETDFVPALNALAEVLTEFAYYNYSGIMGARNDTTIFEPGKSYIADLYELLSELEKADVSAPIISAVKEMRAAFDLTAFASGRGPSFPEAGGLGIYFPFLTYDARYDSKFEFGNTSWDEFLHELQDPGQRPVIEHTPLGNMNNTQGPYTISATITDDDPDASSVTLFYRAAGTLAWNSLAMSYANGTFIAAIPGAPNGTIFEYFITASDLSGNTAYYPYEMTKSSEAALSFEVLAMARVFCQSVEMVPDRNITAGDDVTLLVEIINEGPENPVSATLNVYLDEGSDGARQTGTRAETLIHSETADVYTGQSKILQFNWTAVWGNRTLSFDIVTDGAVNTHTVPQTYHIYVAPAAGMDGDQASGDVVNDGTVSGAWGTWTMPIIILALASLSSLLFLMIARVQIDRKRRENALRSIRRTTVLVNEIGDYGIDNTGALDTLELARSQIKLKNYNKALALSQQAREHVDWKLKASLGESKDPGLVP